MRNLNQKIRKRVIELSDEPDTLIYTNKDLAYLLDVSDQTISNWKKDKVISSLFPNVCVYKLSQVLNSLSLYIN